MGKCSKDKRDPYYRLAKDEKWRARSVYKLLQVEEKFKFIGNSKNIVDLCAAPGSWSQALSKLRQEDRESKIVSVDLQEIEPIKGVVTIQGDITKESTATTIIDEFKGKKADVVVCDGAADITGIHSLDDSFHYFIFTAALGITTHVLKNGGNFMIKIFTGIHTQHWKNQLLTIFDCVYVHKPPASRQASTEAFLIGMSYKPPKYFLANLSFPGMLCLDNLNMDDVDKNELKKSKRLIKYVMCGGHEVDFMYENDNSESVSAQSLDATSKPKETVINQNTDSESSQLFLGKWLREIRQTAFRKNDCYAEDFSKFFKGSCT